MKIQELLLEYDARKIESLAPMYAQRQKDLSAPKTTTVSQLADHVEQDLGVKSGEIVFWILHKYLKPLPGNQYGISRWEDVKSRVIPNLRKFEILKNKKKLPPEQRDLNRLKSLSELEAIVDKFDEQDLQSQTQQVKSIEQQMYQHGDAKLIHDDAQVKVVQPLTEKGSCYFGINTKWCTAAKDDNMFHQYAPGGPIYIVLIKKENRRYQFHWALDVSNIGDIDDPPASAEDILYARDFMSQFMDEKDNPINPNQIADKYPVLWKIFGPIAQKNQSIILNPDPTPALQKSEITRNPKYIQYIRNPNPEIQLLAVSKDPNVIGLIDNPVPGLGARAKAAKAQLDKQRDDAERAARKKRRQEIMMAELETDIFRAQIEQSLLNVHAYILDQKKAGEIDSMQQRQLEMAMDVQRKSLNGTLTVDDVRTAAQAGAIEKSRADWYIKNKVR
jgi:hypothetical protein